MTSHSPRPARSPAPRIHPSSDQESAGDPTREAQAAMEPQPEAFGSLLVEVEAPDLGQPFRGLHVGGLLLELLLPLLRNLALPILVCRGHPVHQLARQESGPDPQQHLVRQASLHQHTPPTSRSADRTETDPPTGTGPAPTPGRAHTLCQLFTPADRPRHRL